MNTKGASEYWSKSFRQRSNNKNKYKPFWEIASINTHINKKISGESLSGYGEGAVKQLHKYNNGKSFRNAISVGCGLGQKEIELVLKGIVEKFTLYDIAEYPLKKAKELAIKKGVEDRISFILGDAFLLENELEKYDLVHWNSSLHHMPDTSKSIEWSNRVLKKNGVLFIFEYIGPNRMQYSEEMLYYANLIRKSLPKKYFKYPGINLSQLKFHRIPIEISKECIKKILRLVGIRKSYILNTFQKIDSQKLIEKDPSEAIDSTQIINSVKKYFPEANIIYLGGVIYNIALAGILHNFDEKKDEALLTLFLFIDDLLSEKNMNLFATVYAMK